MGRSRTFVLGTTVLALLSGCGDGAPRAPSSAPAGTGGSGGGGDDSDGGSCAGAPVGAACPDGDPCNGEETCDGHGTCLPGVPPTVDDGNPCTLDACDPAAGISHAPAAAGTPCADADPCNGVETCDGAKACALVVPPAVDDGDPCTLDSCDPVAGITHGACSALDLTVATTMAQATQFLYSGANPVQVGVAPDAIDTHRAAVIRGQVRTPDGAPLAGVHVEVEGHPELGSTRTFADGMFAMAVNGGGSLVLRYHGDGFLPVSRQVEVPWQDYARAADVVMTPYDGEVTVVDLAAQAGAAVARGSVVSDADGVRQATVIFPPGTQASMVLPGGVLQPLGVLSVRATEYTVGDGGPDAMPATLPPSSGYTYAAELSIDEAIAAGATSVEFTQPIPFYVENFLHFPVGIEVPVGYYDRGRAVWVPSANGRVIEIVGAAGALAEIDAGGDGLADDAAALLALGIQDAERQELAALYGVGTTLWRVPIEHFTPWDCNWPYGPPDDACKPLDPACATEGGGDGGRDPERQTSLPDPCEETGSIIECENQTLGEELDVAGTPFRLHYRSDRVPGRKSAYTLKIPLSRGGVPPSLKRIDVLIDVAGRRFEEQHPCPCAASSEATFSWDGKDAFGRTMQGEQPITVRVGYVYDGVYMTPAQQAAAFAAVSGTPITNSTTRTEVTLWKDWRGMIGTMTALFQGLGGWSPSVHHVYEPIGRTLWLGDGRRRRAEALGGVITTVAGSGCSSCALGDGGPATDAALDLVSGVAVAPDGSVYLTDTGHSRVRKVAPNGTISTTAGNGASGSAGDGGLATAAELQVPRGLAFGPDGSVYIAEQSNRVRRVAPDGVISTFAGTGVFGSDGDGGPATQARLGNPFGVAVGLDGAVYIADRGNHRIRRVGTDGVITTVAGDGTAGFGGDGGPATQAKLRQPRAVAVEPDGALVVVDTENHCVRRIDANGIIRTIAGTGAVGGTAGDGGPATAALLLGPTAIARAPDGSLYVADAFGYRVRRIAADGVITAVAGTSNFTAIQEGVPALTAEVALVAQMQIGPDGALYLAEVHSGSNRVRRIAPPPMGGVSIGEMVVPAEDGREAYVFTGVGKHLRTVDTRTGANLYEMQYDAAGRLSAVVDVDGDTTTIQRDVAGHPVSITGPFGQVTQLAVDADGYLASVTNPANETVGLTYGTGGLLTGLTDALGRAHVFTYDAMGLLIEDEDPAGGSKTLTRFEQAGGYGVTVTTALGRSTTHHVVTLPTGVQQRTVDLPSGLAGTSVGGAGSAVTTTLPDGRVLSWEPGPDPRFGMLSPLVKTEVWTTPGGKTRSVTRSRAATLLDPDDAMSFTTLTDTTVVNGKTFLEVFTKAPRTIARTTPAGRQVTTTLDDAGRVVQVAVPGVLPVQLVYDTHGRLETMTQGTRTLTRVYGPDGFVASILDPLGQSRVFGVDMVGRVLAETRPDGEEVLFGYDAASNMLSVTPPGQPSHGFGFTPVDQRVSYDPPDLPAGPAPTTWSYDLDRKPALVTKPGGVQVSYAYDAAGRPTSITFPGGSITRGYHATTGKLASLSGPAGVAVGFAYDGHLVTDITWSGLVLGSLHRTYNNDLRVTSESVNGASAVSFGYDDDGLLASAGALTVTRDAQNGRVTGSTAGIVADTVGYDAFGAVTQRSFTANGAALFSVTYVRDALDRILERTETIEGATHTIAYAYDAAGRLVDVTKDGVPAAHYTYDENGNRLGRTTPGGTEAGSYDDQDRLNAYGDKTYAYQDSGELLSRMDTAAGETTLYSYDALGNLRHVTLPGGAIVEYVVDGFGRRVGKKVGGVLEKGWLYADALRPAAELDGAGAVVARFVYGEGVNVPDLMMKGGETYRIVTDTIGSVRLVVHATTGAVAQRIDYDEFGRVLLDTNPGFQPFGFAGGLYDPDTGLVRFGARDYDAEVGRWTAKDPLLFDGGDTNLYGYAGNDPVNNQDPRGEETAQTGICRAFARFLPGCVCGGTCPNPLPGGSPPPWNPPPPDPPPRIGICREEPSEDEDERERCKRVKEYCISYCTKTLPTGDFGWRFWNCKNQCMEDHHCPRDS